VLPNETLVIAGHTVTVGMVWVGDALAGRGSDADPALIDPALPVDNQSPDINGIRMGYWPSYSTIHPQSRAAYLAWLAGGRRDPAANVGYVFLFFYGLERRVLDTAQGTPLIPNELDAIDRELVRLLAVYGHSSSFKGYATSLRDVVAHLRFSAEQCLGKPPDRGDETWPAPTALRVGLGKHAAAGLPLPADWALVWAWFDPTHSPRSAQRRVREEFDELFRIRYAAAHGAGVVIFRGHDTLRVRYFPASAGIGSLELEAASVPDVFEQEGPLAAIAAVADGVSDDLDAYSRFVGRKPELAGTLAAYATLPPFLLRIATEPAVTSLRAWARASLGSNDRVRVEGAELIALWGTSPTLRKQEAASAATLLGHLGFGVEPDVRLGGPTLTASPVVLFRASEDTPVSASSTYAAATVACHLGMAVAAADSHIADSELQQLATYLSAAFDLTDGERRRLEAHVDWLTSVSLNMAGLKARLVHLPEAQRQPVGEFLVAVAAADGVITPQEVKTLTKIFTVLGLDPVSVPGRIHRQMAARTGTVRPAPATEPVTVQAATEPDRGYAITPPPAAAADQTAYRGPHGASEPTVSAPSLFLREKVIAAKLADSEKVSALLADIFAEDDVPAEPPPAPEPDTSAVPEHAATVGGLDPAHSTLVRTLADSPTWTRAEFEAVTARLDLLPDGALDVVNEAALDLADELLLDGEDIMMVNPDVLKELLA
jgi:tellurite resistance protein